MNSTDKPSPWRRIVAYSVDYLVIAAYLGVFTVVAFGLRGLGVHLFPESYTTFSEKALGQGIVILVLTLPVIGYFALLEASSWQGSIGKRVLGLRVVGTDDRRISLKQSLIRSGVKFAPWEIAHTAIWHVPGQPFVSPLGAFNQVGLALACLLALWWIGSLFIGSRRTPYDRLASTRVTTSGALGFTTTSMRSFAVP